MIVSSYCRVSTDSDDQNNSFENQKSYFEREIEKHGHKLYRVYADRGLTGTKMNNRPEFNEMLFDAGIDIKIINSNPEDGRKQFLHTIYDVSEREPKFQEIWIKNTSRFARNTLSSEIIDKLRQKNVNVYFLEQNINTKDISQDFILKLFQNFDENDSRDKSSKVRFGNIESAKKGRIRTSGKLFGYRYIQSENRLEIIPDEARIIQYIFNLYAKNEGIRRITNALNDENMFTRQGKSFCKSAIQRILSNEKYCGLDNALKFDTGSVFNKNSYPIVKENYELKETNKIPPIVSKDLFFQCKKIMEGKINHENQKGIYKGLSKYSNMIFCGKCGSVFHSNRDGDRIFYKCSNKKYHGLQACDNSNISENDIDNYVEKSVLNGFKNILYYQKQRVFELAFRKLFELVKTYNSDNSEEAGNMKIQIEAKKDELKNYYKQMALSSSQSDILQELIDDASTQINALQGKYNEITIPNQSIIEQIKNVVSYVKHISAMPIKSNYSEDEILPYLDRFLISKSKYGTDITVQYKILNNSILKLKEDTKDLHPLTKDEIQYIIDNVEKLVPEID